MTNITHDTTTTMVENLKKVADNPELSAKAFFDALKESKEKLDEGMVKELITSAQYIASKALITGQTETLKRMVFIIESYTKTLKLIELGFEQYILRESIDKYAKEVRSKSVYVIELSRFKRVIPDEVIDKIAMVKDIFDEMYVIYTDYSDDAIKQVEKKKKEKDPIVVGCFRNKDTKQVSDMMYIVGDWVDEYCDLTVDQLCRTLAKSGVKNVVHTTNAPDTSIEALKNAINKLESKGK